MSPETPFPNRRPGTDCVGDLQLVLEIAHRTQPTQDEISLMGGCAVDRQPVELTIGAAEVTGCLN